MRRSTAAWMGIVIAALISTSRATARSVRKKIRRTREGVNRAAFSSPDSAAMLCARATLMPTFDPIASPTTRIDPHREPAFVFPEQVDAARAKHARFGRKPNVLVIVFDDVGWGDFGCYGGGIAVGAPTPNIDKLAREGLLLTSCYSEPSCTPTRASIMTGRLPMRHGLLIPPMYGMPGGLQGEVVLPQLLADAGYVTQAVGKWHMGENAASQPQHVGFDDFYGFLSVADMYTERRAPYSLPEVDYTSVRRGGVIDCRHE